MQRRTMAVAAAAAIALAWTPARADHHEGKGTGAESGSKAQGGTAPGGQGARSSQDPLMQRGPAVKGHASDQVLSGRVAKVSEDSVEIEGAQGQSKELKIDPQTLIDGKAGNHEALKEGQQVRASFSEVDGEDVAVEIHSSKGGAGGPAKGPSSERGSTGSQQGGSQEQEIPGQTGGSQSR